MQAVPHLLPTSAHYAHGYRGLLQTAGCRLQAADPLSYCRYVSQAASVERSSAITSPCTHDVFGLRIAVRRRDSPYSAVVLLSGTCQDVVHSPTFEMVTARYASLFVVVAGSLNTAAVLGNNCCVPRAQGRDPPPGFPNRLQHICSGREGIFLPSTMNENLKDIVILIYLLNSHYI